LLKALARLCRRVAQRIDPVTPITPSVLREPGGDVHQDEAVPEPIPPGLPRFRVLRTLGTKSWAIYDGPLGGRARDRFLHEKHTNGPGRTLLEMNGIVRDCHITPSE
jgi:hypothetical protein